MSTAKDKYKHATAAADAMAALHMLDTLAGILDGGLSCVDAQLSRKAVTWAKAMQKERNRMLEIMDAEHAKAGVPRPY